MEKIITKLFILTLLSVFYIGCGKGKITVSLIIDDGNNQISEATVKLVNKKNKKIFLKNVNEEYVIFDNIPFGFYNLTVNAYGTEPYENKNLLINTNVLLYGVVLKTLSFGSKGPASGFVFFDKGEFSDGWRFLEAAPIEHEFIAEWGAFKQDIAGTKTEIGTGKTNTQVITDFLNSKGDKGCATQMCVALEINGFNDWFLPSKDELDAMYKNLAENKLGGFQQSWYWSSTQYNLNFAWLQFFSDGYMHTYDKTNKDRVRAIRTF